MTNIVSGRPDARLRILHVVTMLEMGGAQWNTILSAEEARRRGHESWVAAAPGALEKEAADRLGRGYIPVRSLVREIAPVRDAEALSTLREIIRRLRPDIVHTHSSKAGILGREAARAEHVPAVVHTAHGWAFHDHQPPVVRAIYQAVERRAARLTDRIVVVADANREKALSAGIGRPEQYVTIRSGISVDTALLMQRGETRRELDIPPEAPLMIAVGNFKPQKAPIDLSRTAARVLAANPDAHFIVAGDGPLRAKVEALLAPWSSRVRLLGWRSDATRLLAASDLLLHTALFEGLPRVILEAAALGVSCVSTNVDGIPEAVRDGDTGMLFPPGAVENMADAAGELLRDRDRRAAMGDRARVAFRDEFTLEEMFRRLEHLYQELAAEKQLARLAGSGS